MIRRLALALALSAVAGAASAEFTLTILHTNDVHSRIEPVNRFNSTCPPSDNDAGECFGGAARLATAIATVRAQADASILVDAGDQFQGSLFYTRYKGQAAAEIMNRLGYDAMAVGNHEFDDGPDTLRRFAEAVRFPLLMANADMSGEPALAKVVSGSAVVERGGRRIGLIGVTPVDNPELASPGRGIAFLDPVPAVQAEVDRLAARGVTQIVLLSHSGLDVDRRIASETTGVDVIVGGHSHTLLSNVAENAVAPYPLLVGETAIVQAYGYGRYLGVLSVTFDDAGRVTAAAGEPLSLDGSVAEDPGLKARIAELAAPLDEIRNRVVAEATAPIEGARDACRARECAMGNLVADAMLDRVRGQGVEIALQNGGGLRASIDAGPVTMGEVLTVLPFRNTLSTFEIDGATLLAALENGVSRIEDGSGRFPQVAGLRLTVDPGAPPGARVREVTVAEPAGATPLDPARRYRVVSNDFLRGGGDGYHMLDAARNAYDYGPDLADVVAEYLSANTPFEPALDGRIRMLD